MRGTTYYLLELPITESDSHEDLGNWVQKLSIAVMTLWRHQLISTEAALTANIPGFTYGEFLLSCTAEEVIKLQPRAYVKPQNKTDKSDVVLLNDANNNFSQDQNSSNISDSSNPAHHSDRKTGEELDNEPE